MPPHSIAKNSLVICWYVNYAERMKKLSLILTAALLGCGLVACSDKQSETPAIIETKELPTIDMVATHAIDLDISVSQLTFVPNSAAPWLGRIILLDEEGYLYSTDIEGRAPKPVGKGKYIDIFGLAREAAPGVFLGITANNTIEAFIESDDIGNFSPMIYSGADIAIQTFCQKNNSINTPITVLTLGGKYKTIKLNITDKTVAQEVSDTITPANQSPSCLSQHATLGHNQGNFNVVTGKPSGLHLYQITPSDQKYDVRVNNGLSVRGADRIKYVASTTSNYSGGAYAKGVLALVDADENRIVFISMSYAERQLLKAITPLKDVRE